MNGPKYHRLEDGDPWRGLDDDEKDKLYRDKKYQDFDEPSLMKIAKDERFLRERMMLNRQDASSYCCNVRSVLWTLATVCLCIAVVSLTRILLPCPIPMLNSTFATTNTILYKSRDFEINVTKASPTESSIRLFDVNKDGIDDIILGYPRSDHELRSSEMDNMCTYLNLPSPCAGAVTALDGRDGTLLWEHNAPNEVYGILCGKLDVNQDGQEDCIVAGRWGLLVAVDTTNGAKLWSVDPTMSTTRWNFYQPQVVPDLNGDGVNDVVVTHGGNNTYSAKDTDRNANIMLLLSGKTGKSLGKTFLVTPDLQETYSAVTLYEKKNGAIYVLFGTGGESVKGSLWSISLLDLYCHVLDYGPGCNLGEETKDVPALQRNNYGHWGTPLKTTPVGAMEIIRSGGDKGVIVPTVLADMNKDGILDLIVSIFNGTVALLDGRDLSIIWTTGDRFDGHETYSNPAPGYFNSDDTPDLMIRFSHGNWSVKYDYTLIFILDGTNGQTLWGTQSGSVMPVMASPLSVRGHGNKDTFLFWIQGRNNDFDGDHDDDDDDGDHEGPPSEDPQHRHNREVGYSERVRRHAAHEAVSGTCDELIQQFESELFIMDRDTAENPLRIAKIEPYKRHSGSQKETSMKHIIEKRSTGCGGMMMPLSLATGTVGDLDKDGILDIIYIRDYIVPMSQRMMAGNPNSKGAGLGKLPVTASLLFTVVKKKLDNSVQDFVRLDPEKTFLDSSVKSRIIENKESGWDFKMDMQKSSWMGYCGTYGDCRYE